MVIPRKTSGKEELISVIVPVYKIETYLRECIDSILGNTYQNLEVILVDDGSPNNCGRICDEYAEKDSRVRVIHQKNKGLVGARNAGLAAAAGEYVSFIDSDDVASPILYELLIQCMQREQADLVACENTQQQAHLQIVPSGAKYSYQTTNKDDMLALLTCAPSVRNISWTGCFVWDKLYRRSQIVRLYNPDCLMCEDLRFNYDFIQNCRKMVVIPQALYFYRLNEASICGNYRNHFEKKLLHGIRNAELWMQLSYDSHQDQSLNDYLAARAAYMAHGALWRIYAVGKKQTYQAESETMNAFIHKHFRQLWNDKETYNLRIRLIIWTYCYLRPIWMTAAVLTGKLDK